MTADLTIYEMDYATKNGRQQIIYTVITTIQNRDLIEQIESVGMQSWYLSSESGAEFELLGSEIKKFLPQIQKINKNVTEKDFIDEDFYRLSLSY